MACGRRWTRARRRAARPQDQRIVRPVGVRHEPVNGVLREGPIAAGLTALMILLFLGSWRSTLVVMISIPLSILSSLVVL